ncbi:hypothetical protein G7092_16805 [Mucilaginibacter sp. HC2]|uniref:hypothetical protein n=1 Tax=Mucilaginibacter TaxID=423349 RepID=UPI000DCC03FC|nr:MULTISPECIES: hypothetical protein [Mucilaginibacter]NHA05472.1 hypothetical protein [Mucilaginibacter inviolabilis]QTE35280.1 hypothetical protein J3L18_19280 [Mucilaginibacter gossypii]RAV59513.1 hypothetical protein DIU36_06710 [Mucilaginibacter rubeus]
MPEFLQHKKTNSIISAKDRRIVYFSYEDFIDKIVKRHHCFICGISPKRKTFNNEHVIPNWILRSYGTPASFMILPNQTTIKHTKYTVPCCADCNTELGKTLEIPVSTLLKKSYDEVCAELERDERLYLKLFHWVALLFFKTHLKDTYLPIERDKRKTSGTIAETYCWHEMYHVHSIVRHHYSGAKINDKVYGTIVVYEALVETEEEEFDYLDNLNSQIVMVKVGKIVILAVLNDSRYCMACYKTMLNKITGPLNSVQIRELFARFRYLNMNIKKRPAYYTLIDPGKRYHIRARMPKKIEILKQHEEHISLFKLMRLYIGDLMPPELENREQFLKDLEEGRAQYLFDCDFNFFQHLSFQEKKKKEAIKV